jgi:hypothetical protein
MTLVLTLRRSTAVESNPGVNARRHSTDRALRERGVAQYLVSSAEATQTRVG